MRGSPFKTVSRKGAAADLQQNTLLQHRDYSCFRKQCKTFTHTAGSVSGVSKDASFHCIRRAPGLLQHQASPSSVGISRYRACRDTSSSGYPLSSASSWFLSC